MKANAHNRASNLRSIVDEMLSQGITSVRSIAAELNARASSCHASVAHGTQRLRLGCWRGSRRSDGGSLFACVCPEIATPSSFKNSE